MLRCFCAPPSPKHFPAAMLGGANIVTVLGALWTLHSPRHHLSEHPPSSRLCSCGFVIAKTTVTPLAPVLDCTATILAGWTSTASDITTVMRPQSSLLSDPVSRCPVSARLQNTAHAKRRGECQPGPFFQSSKGSSYTWRSVRMDRWACLSSARMVSVGNYPFAKQQIPTGPHGFGHGCFNVGECFSHHRIQDFFGGLRRRNLN